MFDSDILDPTAQDQVAFSAPVIFWRHGNSEFDDTASFKHTGGFFFTYEQAGDDVEISGWTPGSFKGEGDKLVSGITAKGARIVIVRSRRRWFQDGEGRKEFRPWSQYEKGFRGQMQAVGYVKGYPVPVVFSFKGTILQHIDSIIREHTSKVVSQASKNANGAKLPPYAFWMVVQSGKHETVGQGRDKSEVTMPQLWLPKAVELKFLEETYVGRDMLIEAQDLYKQLDDWAHQWDAGGLERAELPEFAGASRDEIEGAQQHIRAKAAAAGSAQPPSYDEAPPSGGEADEIPFN